MDYFVTGNCLKEDGWRDYSPSRLANVFAKVGYQDGVTDFDVSLTTANNKLEGTQALPRSFLGNRAQPYTWPDRTKNRLAMLNARLSHFFDDNLLFSRNAYFRRKKQDGFASNVNDGCEDTPADCLLAPGALGKEAQGSNDSSTLAQNGYGLTGQVSYLGHVGTVQNQLAVGASLDAGSTRCRQFEQDADIDATRGTNILLDDLELETDVKGKARYFGLYLTDTLSLSETVALTVSGRLNRANVIVEDQSGQNPAINGNHTFTRFNPAAGITHSPLPNYTTYANYSEGMRAPPPVELTCADENAPCPLPNAFLADPPLKPVISRTYEVGTRASHGNAAVSLAVFRTDLRDDIQFIFSQVSTRGYFDNVGNTRRQGVELGGSLRVQRLTLSANCTFMRATFESPFVPNTPNNSSAADLNSDGDAHEIRVSKGNRIPNIPENLFKLRADYTATDAWSLGGNLIYSSGMFLRGDENNQDVHGKSSAYYVLNLDTRYRLSRNWAVFARLNNVFNRRSENFGILGENFFPGGVYTPGSAFSEPFYGVGAPRGLWVGVRYDLDRTTTAALDRD